MTIKIHEWDDETQAVDVGLTKITYGTYCEEQGVFWTSALNGPNSYALVEDAEHGNLNLDGKRCRLYCINGIGEVRWEVPSMLLRRWFMNKPFPGGCPDTAEALHFFASNGVQILEMWGKHPRYTGPRAGREPVTLSEALETVMDVHFVKEVKDQLGGDA